MDIKDLLIEIGFTNIAQQTGTIRHISHIYILTRPYKNAYGVDDIERFTYMRDTNGIYKLTLQKANYVPIKLEVKEENEKLVYDFISNHFGKEYIRNFKLNKLI